MIKLALNYLTSRLSGTILNVIFLAIGIFLIIFIISMQKQINNRFISSGKNIDVVIGAKGSPLQLILSSVYHIDIPTGNIPYNALEEMEKSSYLKKAIPISLGDSYRSFRIVGTSNEYINNFDAKIEQGELWQKSMDAVIGHNVARNTKLKLGDKFYGSHGLVAGDDAHIHDSSSYTVVGILRENNSVLDNLVITDTQSVWDIHADHHHHDHDAHQGHNEEKHDHSDDGHKHDDHVGKEEEHDHDNRHKHDGEHNDSSHDNDKNEDKEITAILGSYSSLSYALSFPRMINNNTNLMAASPSYEIAKLSKVIGATMTSVKMIAIFVIIITFIKIFVQMLGDYRRRISDIVLLRSLGATKKQISSIMIMESLIVTTISCIIGFLIANITLEIIGLVNFRASQFALSGFHFYMEEFCVIISVILGSLLLSLVQVLFSYKIDIAKFIEEK